MIDNIQSRFSDTEELLVSLSIFYCRNSPISSDDLRSFGRKQLNFLLEQYATEKPCTTLTGVHFVAKSLVNADVARVEWETYKRLRSVEQKSLTHQMQNILHSSMFPNLFRLAEIAVCLPVTTASVERSFSHMKMIKTKLRNRLNESSLHHLTMIAIEGPDKLHYKNLEEIMEMWKNKYHVELPFNNLEQIVSLHEFRSIIHHITSYCSA